MRKINIFPSIFNLKRFKNKTSPKIVKNPLIKHAEKCGNCTYDANEWSGETPAELEPAGRVVSDHVLDAVEKAIDSESPRDGDAFEKDQPQQNQIAAGVRVEQLEHVHPSLFQQFPLFSFVKEKGIEYFRERTWATHDNPIRNETKQTTAMKISLRRRNRRGHSSTTAVMKPSSVQN